MVTLFWTCGDGDSWGKRGWDGMGVVNTFCIPRLELLECYFDEGEDNATAWYTRCQSA